MTAKEMLNYYRASLGADFIDQLDIGKFESNKWRALMHVADNKKNASTNDKLKYFNELIG